MCFKWFVLVLQEEMKEVFEGSCKLIPIKPIVKECIQMADEFIPELIEALASQMNPQMVCSVAGLCNSARIAQLLAQVSCDLTIVNIIVFIKFSQEFISHDFRKGRVDNMQSTDSQNS